MGTEALLPEVKWPECEANHLPTFSAKVKNKGSYISLPLYASMACTGTTLPFFLYLYILSLRHGQDDGHVKMLKQCEITSYIIMFSE